MVLFRVLWNISASVSETVAGDIQQRRKVLLTGLQTQSNTNPLYGGPWDAIKKIYTQNGIAGIYKGQAVTLLREASGYGVYFLTYEKIVQWEMKAKGIRRDEINPLNAVLYGAAAGYAVRSQILTLLMLVSPIILLALGGYIPH